MRNRYLGIIGGDLQHRPHLVNQIEHQTGLQHISVGPCLDIFIAPNGDRIADIPGPGIVLGTVFRRQEQPERVTGFRQNEQAKFLDAGAAYLLHDFWGGYVSFAWDEKSRTVSIFRDPSGAKPCYVLEHKDMLVVASDVGSMLDAGLLQAEIDWDYILRYLYAPGLPTARTGLVGVTELMAGCRLSWNSSSTNCCQIWSPWDYVESGQYASTEDFLDRFRLTVRSSVTAWGKCFERILLGVSGGLDSSIVAASLAEIRRPLTFFTMATDEPDGDERFYARALAEFLDIPLIEAFHQLEDINILSASSAHLPRPLGVAYGQSLVWTQQTLSAQLGVDAVFNGYGGDNVFCLMQSVSPVLDRIRVHGMGRGTWRTVNDVCTLTGSSLGDIFKATYNRARKGGASYQWPPESGLLTPQVLTDFASNLSHPWLQAPADALPGKAAHIAKLVGAHLILENMSADMRTSQVSPLLSQPIVEFCLSVPTWKWCEGGQNRSIARQAFADLLPRVVTQRRSKGGPGSFASQVVERSRHILGYRLCNGHLQRQGIIDTRALKEMLDDPRPLKQDDYMRLSVLAETEAWIDHWAEKARTSAGSLPNNLLDAVIH